MRNAFYCALTAGAVILSSLLAARAEPLRVVATIAPIHSLAASVMQGVGEPRLLVKGASSEHTYSLRPSDARALEEAGIVLRVSDRLETFLNKPITTLAEKATVITLADVPGLTLLPAREGGTFEAHDHEAASHDGHDHNGRGAQEGEYDPHLWLDTGNAALIGDYLAEAFAKAQPENAVTFRANAVRLKEKLIALDGELKARLSDLGGARFIVFHDAYHYFENRYGLVAAGSITISPERQPGAARLTAIRAKIAEAGSTCVFSEPQFEPKLVGRLVEGTKAKTGALDGLGAALTAGPDLYFEMMRNLASSLKACLAS
jgi:zinc transport system substrate-binding protein